MRYSLTLMFIALAAAFALWAARRYVYPAADDHVAAVVARIPQLEERIKSIANAGQDLTESEANQLVNSLGELQEEIRGIKQRDRIRSWLTNGQLLFVIIAVACQLAFLRQQLRSKREDRRTIDSTGDLGLTVGDAKSMARPR